MVQMRVAPVLVEVMTDVGGSHLVLIAEVGWEGESTAVRFPHAPDALIHRGVDENVKNIGAALQDALPPRPTITTFPISAARSITCREKAAIASPSNCSPVATPSNAPSPKVCLLRR